MRLLFAAGVVFADFAICAGAYAGPSVFSTGVDNSGRLLPVGTVDPHYVVTSVPMTGDLPAIVSSVHPSWVADTESSQWINPTGNGMDYFDVGTYSYETQFDVSGYDPASLVITGSWASDNASRIYLNGVDTGWLSPGGPNNELGKLTDFTIAGGFRDGINRLRFDVVNTGFQSGLHVHIDAVNAVATPEPGSIAVTAFAFGAGVLLRRRRRG